MKAKNLLILVTGLFFYAWGEPKYIIIMIISTLIDYTAGRFIDHFDKKPKIRTVFLLVSVVMNLGLLAVFKYSSFLITTVNSIFGTAIPSAASYRNFVLYVPEYVLYDRSVYAKDKGSEKPYQLYILCYIVPADSCRTDSSL